MLHVNDGVRSRQGNDDERAKALMHLIEDIASGETALSLLRHHEDVDAAVQALNRLRLQPTTEFVMED